MQTAGTTASADAAQFLKECHAALHQHTGGNPRPFLGLWSRAPDVSLMGGVGGHQVGIDAVSALLTAAAKTLNYETWDAETLASSFGDELGFTVELEQPHSQDRRQDRRNEPQGNLGLPQRGWRLEGDTSSW
jgi:hypothetical protein